MAKMVHYDRSRTTAVRNDMLQSKLLTLKAKGMLCLLLSFPDGWEYKRDHIMTKCQEGRTVWESTMKELITRGYIARHRVNRDRGRFTYDYLISDRPLPIDVAERFAKTGKL